MSEFTVLGLLGPAGSGKDLVADWFVAKGFVKVAFADPMKRFVAKTFGVSDERLWGPSEKRNEMFAVDETWWYEAIGKLASSTNEIVQNVLSTGTRVNGYLKLYEWFTKLHETYKEKISARLILQTLGTEWGREVDPLMWARYAHHLAYELSIGRFVRYEQHRGLYELPELRVTKALGVVIPDHRFRNEVELTQESGGYVIRLNRLSMEATRPDIGVAGHRSEAEHKELPDHLFDAVYELPEGVDKVTALLADTYSMKPWARQWDKTNELECNIVRYDPISPSVI